LTRRRRLFTRFTRTAVSGSQAGTAYWLVAWDQQTKKEYVRLRRLGRDILTEGRQIPFNRAPSQITLSFWLQSEDKPVQEQRRWNISLRPATDAAPLLVFRSADGSLLRWNQSLPPEILLLLYPTDVQLKFDGGGELRHQCRLLGVPGRDGEQTTGLLKTPAWYA